MKRYENPKCTHAFILHSFPMIKSLPKVLILYPFGHLMNFWIYTSDSLPFKTISHLTMICYYQNSIRRTLGLTSSKLFFNYIWSIKRMFLDLHLLLNLHFILVYHSTLISLFWKHDRTDRFNHRLMAFSIWFGEIDRLEFELSHFSLPSKLIYYILWQLTFSCDVKV